MKELLFVKKTLPLWLLFIFLREKPLPFIGLSLALRPVLLKSLTLRLVPLRSLALRPAELSVGVSPPILMKLFGFVYKSSSVANNEDNLLDMRLMTDKLGVVTGDSFSSTSTLMRNTLAKAFRNGFKRIVHRNGLTALLAIINRN